MTPGEGDGWWLHVLEESVGDGPKYGAKDWVSLESVFDHCQLLVDDACEDRNFVVKWAMDGKKLKRGFLEHLQVVAGKSMYMAEIDRLALSNQEKLVVTRSPAKLSHPTTVTEECADHCRLDHDTPDSYKMTDQDFYFRKDDKGEPRKWYGAFCWKCATNNQDKPKKHFGVEEGQTRPSKSAPAYVCRDGDLNKCNCMKCVCQDCYATKLTMKKRRGTQVTCGDLCFIEATVTATVCF